MAPPASVQASPDAPPASPGSEFKTPLGPPSEPPADPVARARAPERIRFSLAAKIGLLIAVAALVAAEAVGTFVVRGYEAELIKREDARLAQQERREADVLRFSVGQMVDDVRFLALTPPVTGIPRARAAGGVDPVDGSTGTVWRERLTRIFTALAASRPDYLQVRYIAATGSGDEWVRVDRRGDAVTVVPRDGLQPKGDRPFVRGALALGPGRVYLSPIELNQEHGAVTPDHTPVLRAATAVAGADGRPVGVVVINMDFRPVLERLAAIAPRGTTVYVTDERGEFLVHPDPARTFAFDLGGSDRIQALFPATARLLDAGAAPSSGPIDALTARVDTADGVPTILRIARIHFHPDDPSRFVALALTAPENRGMIATNTMRRRAIGTVLVLTLLLAAGTYLVGLRLIRPLRHITQAVAAFPASAGVPLPVDARDEIGTLARTFVRIRAERLADEARLNAAVDELARSNAELDAFAYIASHDLKEPLRGIHNYASFLLEDYADRLDAEGADKLHTLARLARRLETLIDTLLHFSRVGRAQPAAEPVDLNGVLNEVVASIHVFLEERGITVRVPRPLPTVPCDRTLVGEVFLNLVTNAAKYNDKPDPWVEVTWSEAPGGPVLHVRDNGIGIPEKHRDAVFRIFKRLHGRDAYGGGTGAGLTIARKIVERHGGRIWLESEPGAGTTFHFTLSGDPT